MLIFFRNLGDRPNGLNIESLELREVSQTTPIKLHNQKDRWLSYHSHLTLNHNNMPKKVLKKYRILAIFHLLNRGINRHKNGIMNIIIKCLLHNLKL